MLILLKLERLVRRLKQNIVVNLRCISAAPMYDTLIHTETWQERKALLGQEIEKVSGTNSVQDRTAM